MAKRKTKANETEQPAAASAPESLIITQRELEAMSPEEQQTFRQNGGTVSNQP